MADPVDCNECHGRFTSFKQYINHLLSKACAAAKKEVVTVPVTPTTTTTNTPTTGVKRTAGQMVAQMETKRPRTTTLTSSYSATIKPSGVETSRSNIPQTQAKKTVPTNPVPSKAPARPTKVLCNLCEKPCKSTRGLAMHMNTSHKCGYCDNMFANLEEHSKNVHETEACTECDLKFATVASLENHMTNVHQIKCESCEKNFYNEDTLKDHTKEEHEEECEICFERFATALNLLEPHQLLEHGIKPRVVKTFAGGMFMIV